MNSYFVVFCIVLFAAVTYVKAEDEMKEEFCSEASKKINGPCSSVKCNKDNTIIRGMGCALDDCPKGILRTEKEDLSKPFPQCCKKLICKK